MAHLDNLIQTLGLRLRFCPPQPRHQLGRVAASSSSCHASKQTSRFHSLHPRTTNKSTGNVNIPAAASRRSPVLVTFPATALLPSVTNPFALAKYGGALDMGNTAYYPSYPERSEGRIGTPRWWYPPQLCG
jgi:hypothetical protein